MKYSKVLFGGLIAVFVLGVITWMAYKNKSVSENQQKASSNRAVTFDAAILGRYFEPGGAEHYLILKSDHTFVHNRIDDSGQAHLVNGTYSITNSQITFVYGDGSKPLQLNIVKQPPTTGWYITGEVGGVKYYFVQE